VGRTPALLRDSGGVGRVKQRQERIARVTVTLGDGAGTEHHRGSDHGRDEGYDQATHLRPTWRPCPAGVLPKR
jgi:hypothetical protein